MSFIAVIAGARPNFMKVDPLLKEFRRRSIPAKLIHTGQHYDKNMSDVFFHDLEIEEPHVHLGAGSASHAKQTADIMVKYEDYCLAEKPSWSLVVGDVNSTVACSLVAAKLGIKVCHLEAGLRSRDWEMPEEINRVVTDRLSDLLLTPSPDGNENLIAEGVPKDRIKLVGNIMIDTLFRLLPRAKESLVHEELNLTAGEYALATLHRPSNVDTKEALGSMIGSLTDISEKVPVVLPVHPRTRKKLEDFGLLSDIESNNNFVLTEPKGYIDFQALSSNAKIVLTDSGGLQEETTAMGIPCLTLRENTERPITVTQGTNRVVGTERATVVDAALSILDGNTPAKQCPELWDGKTAGRCADVIEQLL